MPEYGVSPTRILQYKDKIVDYGKISVSENPYDFAIFYAVVEKGKRANQNTKENCMELLASLLLVFQVMGYTRSGSPGN